MNTVKLNREMIKESSNQSKGIIILINQWINKQAEHFEATRFGMMAIYITAQSCLGSIACMYILQNNASIMWLATCAAVTMACNAVFIAQGNAKWCLGAFYLSVVVNVIFILGNM